MRAVDTSRAKGKIRGSAIAALIAAAILAVAGCEGAVAAGGGGGGGGAAAAVAEATILPELAVLLVVLAIADD